MNLAPSEIPNLLAGIHIKTSMRMKAFHREVHDWLKMDTSPTLIGQKLYPQLAVRKRPAFTELNEKGISTNRNRHVEIRTCKQKGKKLKSFIKTKSIAARNQHLQQLFCWRRWRFYKK